MDTSLYISAGALQSFQKKVDTISNNVANVNTNGFKRRETSFSEILANQIDNQTRQDQEVGRLTPQGIRVGYGTRIGLTQLEMDQGQAIQTGNPFDLMINGKGFFKIGHPNSDKNGTYDIRYTRDGAFHLSPNAQVSGTYHLVNQSGEFVLDANGDPIVLDNNKQVKINENGDILVNGEGTSTQRIALVNIENPHILQNTGDNEFQVDTKVIANGANPMDFEQPFAGQISSGYLEGSNVDLTKEMSDLINTQRGFQLNARAVSYADQMMGIANSILK